MKFDALKAALLLGGALFLGACQPGDDSSAGIEGTGSPATVSGSVTSYGSIFVNGIRVEIGEADIRLNGALAGEDDVQLGMVVDVEAEQTDDETWVAQQVRYRRVLRGVVSELLEASDVRKVLRVLGQTLLVYDDTLLDGIDFESLEAGATIDVSGFVDAEGRWVVSRLAAVDAGAEPEVRGALKSVDPDQARFVLGELTVDYSNAVFEAGAADELAEGQQVRVRGGSQQDGVLAAEQVRFEPDEAPPENVQASREGLIQAFESAEQFTLGGLSVDATGAPVSGGEASELGAGVRVAVSGQIAGGVLQASEVRLLLPGLERIRARVDAIDAEAGELVVLGTTYKSSALTAFEDRRANGNRLINLQALRPDETVEIHARRAGADMLATRIKRLEPPDDIGEVDVRGPVTVIGDASITVMNVQVDLTALDPDLVTVFLDEVQLGDRVRVRGTLTSGNSITAEGLTLSDLVGDEELCTPLLGELCDDQSDLDLQASETEKPSDRF